jgi:hypothetical protein
MNSRGNMLTSEVLKIVVAVICIAFLVYFLSALYYSKVNTQKTIEARSSLDQVRLGIINMEQNSLTEFKIFDTSPIGWWVFGFVSPELKPNSCSGENCLCICKKSAGLLGNNLEKQLTSCDEKGACELIENLQDFVEFKLDSSGGNFSGIKVKSVGGNIGVEKI